MENKLPTAEEIWELGSLKHRDYKGHEQELINKGTFKGLLIEFGRLCAKAALQEAAEKAVIATSVHGKAYIIDKQSILESFNLDNIK